MYLRVIFRLLVFYFFPLTSLCLEEMDTNRHLTVPRRKQQKRAIIIPVFLNKYSNNTKLEPQHEHLGCNLGNISGAKQTYYLQASHLWFIFKEWLSI